MNTDKILNDGSINSRIEASIVWAKGRMCRPCRAGDQVCPACVKAQEAVELLGDLLAEQALKTVAPKGTPVVAPAPVAPVETPKATKPGPCDLCASGELLFDGEVCEGCGHDRTARKLKTVQRFWEAK
jgi:hypothetical protein